MESVVSRSAPWRSETLRRVDHDAVRTWALVGTVVLYLAINGGGYDLIVRSQVAIVVWWIVLIGAAWGLLPAVRWTRTAWIGAALLGGFVVWTGLSATWSESSELSLQELSRVACYFGLFLLGIAIHRDRARGVQHTLHAVSAAVVIVAALAVASRLRPDLFPAAHQTASYLPGTEGRLGWPLNYWNALAALMALGLPLLLATATSARTLPARAVAAGAIPLVALCTYLTFSRGGALAAGAGLLVFFAFSPERVEKLATALVAATGSGAVILAATHRPAIEQGLTSAAARHEGDALLVSLVIVCAGVALAQTGVALAARHGTPPRWLTFSPRRARALLVAAVTTCVVVALLAGAPGRLSHAWQEFKHPSAAGLRQDSLARFGTASGNGRYDYWKVAIDATSGHLLDGSGAGTFQLLWAPRAPYFSYVQNAHSLYVETLAETGIVGVVLLGGFFVLVLGATVRLSVRSRYEARVRAAGFAGAMFAFCVAAASDWIWQVPAAPRGVPGPGGSSARAPACQIQRGRVAAVTPRRDRARGRSPGRDRGPARDGEHRAGESGGRAGWQLGAGAGRRAHRGAARARRGLRSNPVGGGTRAPRPRARGAGRCPRSDGRRAEQLERMADRLPLGGRGRSTRPRRSPPTAAAAR